MYAVPGTLAHVTTLKHVKKKLPLYVVVSFLSAVPIHLVAWPMQSSLGICTAGSYGCDFNILE